jgi:SAM-dependent methyltransferase
VIAIPPALRQGARDAFDAMPEPARKAVRAAVGRPGPRQIPLESLDAELAVAADLFGRSEDRARAFLDRLVLVPPAGAPDDPFSAAYREWTWSVYRGISGRSDYSLGNESSPIDVAAALERPYPFASGSPSVVGEDLEARGSVLRCLAGAAGLTPPARVVEFGPGWGNLTMDLVATGFDVTAVEIDPGFCRLLAARTVAGGRLEVINGDMLSYDGDASFDAAVFYESFHHCANHASLLERLHTVVRPGGCVLFAGEPLQAMPYPWGPRLDGLSLWSMRTYGWLELGFTPRYFRRALARAGWAAERHGAGMRRPKAAVVVARADGSRAGGAARR